MDLVALDLASWGVTDPAGLTFLDPPPPPAWAEATALLRRLDAIDATGRITTEGKALAGAGSVDSKISAYTLASMPP